MRELSRTRDPPQFRVLDHGRYFTNEIELIVDDVTTIAHRRAGQQMHVKLTRLSIVVQQFVHFVEGLLRTFDLRESDRLWNLTMNTPLSSDFRTKKSASSTPAKRFDVLVYCELRE